MLAAVELHQKHALPSAQTEGAADDGEAFGSAKQRCATVRVTILALACREIDRTAAEVVVSVAAGRRCHAGKEHLEVGQKQRLVFVDEQTGRRVTRLDHDKSGKKTRLANRMREQRRDVD